MKFRFVASCAVALVPFVALAGCSPQALKNAVKDAVVKRKAAIPPRALPTRLEWRSQPEVPRAGLPAIWSLKVLDLTTKKDKPKGVRSYETPRVMPMHLFVVSRDLSRFVHYYPNLRDYGNFLLRPVIPEPGAYQLFVDYVPIGLLTEVPGFPTVQSQRFLVAGDKPAPAPQKLMPDKPQNGWLVQRVQSRVEQEWAPAADAPFYEVQLQDAAWQAKRELTLRARVLDAAKSPVPNLGLHLKGVAYGVAISQDGQQFVRLEAAKEQASGEIIFKGTFPVAGIYKIWLEFNHNNQLILAPFTVRVAPKRSN